MSRDFDSDTDGFDTLTSPNGSGGGGGGGGGGVGLSNIQLSGTRRRMLDLVNRLHSTGIQIDIDLPQIAVIGSQSAGKSSLIESISGITLPRAAGTCTRCPTECRLSYSKDPWKCVVSLRLNNDGRIRNEPFGATIYDKAEVEERIRRAQLAILSPRLIEELGVEYFLGDDVNVGTSTERSFSMDCVSLQISGPDVADLSFCDLPGLIANAGRDGNAGDINLIRQLVTSYIKRENCIILLTVACETDFQNQGAQEIAREFDPEGKRTIGVLTKPDRIPSGEEIHWISLIKNEKEPLENGWYCVKQPSSKEIKEGLTWEQARQREREFFEGAEPWRELDSYHRKHLRTHNLVERLSNILSDLISKRLPGIQKDLEDAIESTREEIAKLPRPPSADPFSDILNLLHNFIRELGVRVEGVPDEDGLLQTIRPQQKIFRRAIRVTAPEFIPFEKRFAATKVITAPAFLDFEEEADLMEENLAQGANQSIPEVEANDRRIYIDEVLDRAQKAQTRELPGHYPFVVQKTYIKGFTKDWGAPAQRLCKAVYSILHKQVRELIHEHFQTFGQGQLENRVRVLVHEHLNHCLKEAENRVEWLLKLESDPFTLNTHYLQDYGDKFLMHYASARARDRNPRLMEAIDRYNGGDTDQSSSYPQLPQIPSIRAYEVSEPVGIPKVFAGLSEISLTGVKAEDLTKLLPADGTEPALKIMSDVRGYFQVAYKRFVDNVPLAIDYELVRGIERDLLQVLNKGLKISTPEGHQICRDLAQERPHIATRRLELEKKLERMQAATEQLLSL